MTYHGLSCPSYAFDNFSIVSQDIVTKYEIINIYKKEDRFDMTIYYFLSIQDFILLAVVSYYCSTMRFQSRLKLKRIKNLKLLPAR